MDVRVTGGQQMRALARDLRAAGSPGRGLRSKMRRNMVAAVKPMQAAVKQNIIMAIPATGERHTGLRRAMARATKIRVNPAGRNPVVRLWVNPKLMPEGKSTLPAYMEGSDGVKNLRWRHPVFGDEDVWVPQASHRYFAPAVMPRLAGVRAACLAAVAATAAEVERGV